MSNVALEWLSEQSAQSISTAFSAMTGETLTITGLLTPGVNAGAADSFRWEQVFSVGAESLLWLEAPAASWKMLAEQILRTAGLDEFDEPSLRSTFVEMLQQSLTVFAQALGERLKREVGCANGAEVAAIPGDEPHRYELRIAMGDAQGTLQFCVSRGLLALLGVESGRRATVAAENGAGEKRAPIEAQTPNTLGLLMEVELPVGVSFGRAQMRLKDVIKLTTGSIVELNRSVVEPVEIIVNNCVIARGEVVVVEGNYGVRIQHIVSREERLRTLY